jgi:[ribosomal protein S5]-alanine N-acetyltransferase
VIVKQKNAARKSEQDDSMTDPATDITSPPFLVGERLFLRPLSESDIAGPYVEWFNDEEVCRGNSHHVFPYTPESARAYVRQARNNRDALILAIVLKDEETHIGNISLQEIHWIYRSAEFAVVIGDRRHWGKRFSIEAGRLLCDHGFRAMNLNRIYCGTFEDNVAMRRLALALGMLEEGRRRGAAFKRGRYLDIIEYGALKTDYEALHFNKE